MNTRIVEAGTEMKRYVERCLPKCIPLIPFIIAQMCHESGYGTSLLSIEANNFAGMKDRPGVGNDTKVYTDWQNKTAIYEKCASIKDFPPLYFQFLGRSVYRGWYDHREDGDCFIKHLEDSGWCGSTPGRKSYTTKILDLMESKRFKQVMSAINQDGKIPDWLGDENS